MQVVESIQRTMRVYFLHLCGNFEALYADKIAQRAKVIMIFVVTVPKLTSESASRSEVGCITFKVPCKFDTNNCSPAACSAVLASSAFRRCVGAGASVSIEGALAA
jgi:hypothetical protein